jgi:hypothetical protein
MGHPPQSAALHAASTARPPALALPSEGFSK